MSDPHHGPTAGPAQHFTEADLAAFRKDDVLAGGAVVVLMTTIFTIGLILYSIVLIAVAY